MANPLVLDRPDQAPLLPPEEPPAAPARGNLNGRVVVPLPPDPDMATLFTRRVMGTVGVLLIGLAIGFALSHVAVLVHLAIFPVGGLAALILISFVLRAFIRCLDPPQSRPVPDPHAVPDPKINQAHLLALPEVELQVPPAPETEASALHEFALRNRPEAAPMIKRILNTLVEKPAFKGTPKAGTPQLEKWYQKLEIYLRHTAHFLTTTEVDPGIVEALLDELATIPGRCGGAYMNTARLCYESLSGQSNPEDDLKTAVLKLLARFRLDVLTQVQTVRFQSSDVHTKNQMLLGLGKELGIPGAEFADENDPYKPFPETLLRQLGRSHFWDLYRPKAIVDRMADAINRDLKGEHLHELSREKVLEALQAGLERLKVPADFQPEEDEDTRKINFLCDGQAIRREAIEFLLEELEVFSKA